MASEAQISAKRENAQKSTGPESPEGKGVGAPNTVMCGRLARAAVLQGEDWEEWTWFRENLMEELYPDGMQEQELAGRIVDLTWRLRRAGEYQNAVFEALYDKHAAEAGGSVVGPDADVSVPADPVLGRMLLADFSGDRVLERVLLYERRIESSLYRARAELRQLRNQRVNSVRRGATAGRRWDGGLGLDDEPAMSARNRWRQAEPQGGGQGPQGGSQLGTVVETKQVPPVPWERGGAGQPALAEWGARRPGSAVPGGGPAAAHGRPDVPEAVENILAVAHQDAEFAENEEE